MKELTGRHVLIILLVFFGVVGAVNFYFAYMAISTVNSREANGSYDEGLHYNQRIEAEHQQAVLGWSHKMDLPDDSTVRFTLTDKSGAPVTGLKVRGEIGKPAADRYDHQITFTEAQPGIYTASTNELEAGGWIIAVIATKSEGGNDQVVYRVKERRRVKEALWPKPKPKQ